MEVGADSRADGRSGRWYRARPPRVESAGMTDPQRQSRADRHDAGRAGGEPRRRVFVVVVAVLALLMLIVLVAEVRDRAVIRAREAEQERLRMRP